MADSGDAVDIDDFHRQSRNWTIPIDGQHAEMIVLDDLVADAILIALDNFPVFRDSARRYIVDRITLVWSSP